MRAGRPQEREGEDLSPRRILSAQYTQSAGTPVMASVCGLMFCSSRFAKELFYHLHLSWCEDALVASVTEVGEGLVYASGFSAFLAESLEGGFVVLAFASRFVKTTLYKANKNEIHKQKEYFV